MIFALVPTYSFPSKTFVHFFHLNYYSRAHIFFLVIVYEKNNVGSTLPQVEAGSTPPQSPGALVRRGAAIVYANHFYILTPTSRSHQRLTTHPDSTNERDVCRHNCDLTYPQRQRQKSERRRHAHEITSKRKSRTSTWPTISTSLRLSPRRPASPRF